jgi:hypothetical protein
LSILEVEFIKEEGNDKLKLGFGKDPADSDELLYELDIEIEKLIESKVIKGGALLLIDGKMTIINAMYLGKKLAPYYSVIAANDPKIDCYVVVVSVSASHQFTQRI